MPDCEMHHVCQLSIVVPAAGSQPELDRTLVSILENRPGDCEIVVPHDPDYEDPYDLADEIRFVPTSQSDYAGLVNAGVHAASASLIHLLMPGVQVVADWTNPAVTRMCQEPDLAMIAPVLLDPRRPNRILASGVRYCPSGVRQAVDQGRRLSHRRRRSRRIDAPTVQAGFYRDWALESLGPWSQRFGFDHLDTVIAARSIGLQWTCEPCNDIPITGVYRDRRRGFHAACDAERLYRYFAIALGEPRPVGHACHVIADLTRHLPLPDVFTSAWGRVWGRLTPGERPSETIREPIADTSDRSMASPHRKAA